MDDKILNKIIETITKHKLIAYNDSVLCALSGGADSVFLLNALLCLKEKFALKLYACHLNHGLRGRDATLDEEFCVNLCKEKNVPLFTKRADVSGFAKESGMSVELAGRKIRYDFFLEIAQKEGIFKIATAHNQDDNVETVLMRFIRGTGISGLCGIPYKNKNIIRPILDITREEIEAFFEKEKLKFMTDKTNFSEIYTRNKIRLSLIPQIEASINTGFKKTLSSNILNFKELSDFLSVLKDEAYKRLVKDNGFYTEFYVNKSKKEHSYIIKAVIIKILEKFSCEILSDTVNEVFSLLEEEKGKINISGNVFVVKDLNKLYFYKDLPEAFCYEINTDNVKITEINKLISFDKVDKINKNSGKNIFYADRDKLGRLTVRTRKNGDFFFPSGLNNKVKLKDYFINEKVPFFLRNTVPVLCSDDDICWVCGYRFDERFCADENTLNIVRIKLLDGGF